MRKILLLALGGTIACAPTRLGLMPRLTARDLLSRGKLPRDVSVDGVDFLRRTIVFPDDWSAIAEKIFSMRDVYDGFCITLGTDTLAYLGAALSVALENFRKPIVLTGAMIPPFKRDSDAMHNFRDALSVSKSKVPGVYVVFNGKIMRAAAVSKVRADSIDAFESINERPLGHVHDGRLLWRIRPRAEGGDTCLRNRFETNVANITLMPQMIPGFVVGLERFGGVLIEGYGDGNIPNNLVPALLRLARRRVVVLASQCTYGAVYHHYEGGVALVRGGALSAKTMTKEMALVKLMWTLGQTKNVRAAKRSFVS